MAEKKEKTKVSETEQALIEENENLIKETETLKGQVEEFKDKWMRNVAEFDNYKKRNAKLWSDAFNEGVSSVILKILPVGDNLDWALTLGLDEKTAEGIKGIRKKFEEVLESLEVTEINPVGKPFDPNEAEAVMQVEGEEGEESETVKMVFQKGYRKGEKIIRYAKVSVVK
ncbi:MAG: nucleotide exchange factor GrpE [Clostridia bacterium]|nr:nucleotide exchange factor GrpE [Clostridia bacterium]